MWRNPVRFMHEPRSRIDILFSQTTEIMIACFGLANCQILQYLRIYHFTSHRSINQLALDKKMFGKHSFWNHRLVWQSKCSYQWDSLTIDWERAFWQCQKLCQSITLGKILANAKIIIERFWRTIGQMFGNLSRFWQRKAAQSEQSSLGTFTGKGQL